MKITSSRIAKIYDYLPYNKKRYYSIAQLATLRVKKTSGDILSGRPLTMRLYQTVSRLLVAQEAQLSPRDRAMRPVSSNLANYHATVQKLLIRQVLTKPMV